MFHVKRRRSWLRARHQCRCRAPVIPYPLWRHHLLGGAAGLSCPAAGPTCLAATAIPLRITHGRTAYRSARPAYDRSLRNTTPVRHRPITGITGVPQTYPEATSALSEALYRRAPQSAPSPRTRPETSRPAPAPSADELSLT